MGIIEDAGEDVFGPGVKFVTPPDHMVPALTDSITRATAALEPDDKVVVVGIATETGMNGAVVAQGAKGWDVVAWIGKDWGAPRPYYGVGVLKRWKRKE